MRVWDGGFQVDREKEKKEDEKINKKQENAQFKADKGGTVMPCHTGNQCCLCIFWPCKLWHALCQDDWGYSHVVGHDVPYQISGLAFFAKEIGAPW